MVNLAGNWLQVWKLLTKENLWFMGNWQILNLVDLGGSDPWMGQAPTPENDDVYFECGQQVHSELSECPMTQDNICDYNKRRHPSSDEDEVIIEVVKIKCSTFFRVFSKFPIGPRVIT